MKRAFDDKTPLIYYGDPDAIPTDWRKDLVRMPGEDNDDPEDVGNAVAVIRLLGFDPSEEWKDEIANVGTATSGNFGHEGIPGHRGGSMGNGGGATKLPSHVAKIFKGEAKDIEAAGRQIGNKAQVSQIPSEVAEYGNGEIKGNPAIQGYCGLDSAPIKDYLHGHIDEALSPFSDTVSGERQIQDSIATIDISIDEAPQIPAGVTMYRGISDESLAHSAAGLSVGDVFEDTSFQSHSLNPYVADRFTRMYEDIVDSPDTDPDTGEKQKVIKAGVTVLRAITDGNIKGVYIPETSDGLEEYEVLIARGTQWKVIGKDEFLGRASLSYTVLTVVPV